VGAIPSTGEGRCRPTATWSSGEAHTAQHAGRPCHEPPPCMAMCHPSPELCDRTCLLADVPPGGRAPTDRRVRDKMHAMEKLVWRSYALPPRFDTHCTQQCPSSCDVGHTMKSGDEPSLTHATRGRAVSDGERGLSGVSGMQYVCPHPLLQNRVRLPVPDGLADGAWRGRPERCSSASSPLCAHSTLAGSATRRRVTIVFDHHDFSAALGS
jgi:hypothetical protein